MEVSSVPKDQVWHVWQIVAPMLQKALDRAPGRYDLSDILVGCMTGAQCLWIAFEETDIVAAWTTRMYAVPLGKIFSFEWIGGDRMPEWVHRAIELGESMAKDEKCTRIEGHGRDGWGAFLKDHGWRKFASSFEREIRYE